MLASLRNIAAAQRVFRDAGHGDSASFAELTGAAGVRGGALLETPLLAPSFRPAADGSVRRGGYYFRLDRADGRWCCYAWPVEAGDDLRPTFHIDAGERIRSTLGYVGGQAPPPGAVTRDGSAWTDAGGPTPRTRSGRTDSPARR